MTLYTAFAGINEYAYNSDENRLRGCVNDSLDLVARFPSDHILIVDKQATKQNIMVAWQAQRDKCQPGDILRIGHSGHGIEDGLCCYNLRPQGNGWNPNGYIAYPEIVEFCKEIPLTITVEFLFDCCHCADKIKTLAYAYGKAKYFRRTSGALPIATPAQPARPSSVKENVIFWAACEPEQTSADAYIDNKAQGAFTAAFLQFEQPGRSRSDIIYYARAWLKKQGYQQTPHLYSWPDRAMAPMVVK